MDDAGVAVKSFCSQYGSCEGLQVRVIGQDIVESYLAECMNSTEADMVRAWLSEMKHHVWTDSDALRADFRNVDLSAPTLATFHLASARTSIVTLISFRNGVVLVRDLLSCGNHAVVATQSRLEKT